MDFPEELYDGLKDAVELAKRWLRQAQGEPSLVDDRIEALSAWVDENRPVRVGDFYSHIETGRVALKVIDIEDGKVAYWNIYPNGGREASSMLLEDFPKTVKFWKLVKCC